MQSGKYFVNIKKQPIELRSGILQLMDEYPLSNKKTGNTKEICFLRDKGLSEKGGLKVCKRSDSINVSYGRAIDAFRALGRLFGEKHFALRSDFAENSKFDLLGVSLDVSRNGVMRPENVKAFLRRCALMGINTVMLYAEDVYEVPEQPFFGYLRGRYTQRELRDMDVYAFNLGIEMFLSIQTLAHLMQALQWGEAYGNIIDIDDILLVGEEKTYKFIEQMISAASSSFRSKRIHIGMDEAHRLGTGKYKKHNGERRTFDIMAEHLGRVSKICAKFGLEPMMWSDMFFRCGSKTGDYYDVNAKIPQDVAKSIPKNVELVYWDYYHTESGFYEKYIDLHRNLGKEPIVASGAWNWNYLWADLPFAYSTIEPCMQACKNKNVRSAFLTTWGDDGMENDIYSVLPAIQFFAEHGYCDTIDKKLLKANFFGSCNADIDGYDLAAMINAPPYIKNYRQNTSNVCKWLLWDDPLIGLCEPQQENRSFRKYYEGLAKKLEGMIGNDPDSKRLRFPAQISKVLAIKCDCRKSLVKAYKQKNKKELARLLRMEVEPLLREEKKLWLIHRDMWLKTYKPLGIEVLEMRYGGLIIRTQSLIDRLKEYLKGDIKNIPEFETKLLKFLNSPKGSLALIGSYHRIVTPSSIS